MGKRAAAKKPAESPPKKPCRIVVYTTEVQQIARAKKNTNFEPYEDWVFIGKTTDNARAMPMMLKDSVGWREKGGRWAPEEPAANQNYLRRTKIEVSCLHSHINAITNAAVGSILLGLAKWSAHC